MRCFFKLTSFSGSRAPKADLPAGLGTAYGHNVMGIEHNTVISRGSQAGLAASFESLKSHEDIKYYNDNVPLKIYRRQEIHITSETSDGSEHTRPSQDRISQSI